MFTDYFYVRCVGFIDEFGRLCDLKGRAPLDIFCSYPLDMVKRISLGYPDQKVPVFIYIKALIKPLYILENIL